ncbi:MAG: hypothetical protein JJT88_00595 [Gammaproteobacteria bacterium]|nr:hypothetical protein [Gammaproteobacteria bacterium]
MTTTTSSSVPRRPFNARPIYRGLQLLALPRPWLHTVLSAAKRLTVREQIAQRAALAKALPEPAPEAIALDEDRACRQFLPAELPGAIETAQRCAELYAAFRARGEGEALLQRNRNKPFLLSLVAGNEFAQHPDLLRFAVARPLLDAASRYLGTVPIVEGMALWWTPPNESSKSSQAWHIDELAPRQVKVQLNCLEVTAEQGPLHYIPAQRSQQARTALGHNSGRISDAAVEGSGAIRDVERVLGPEGSGVILDSSRCLHYGSRGNTHDRLVLTFHYMPLDAPTETRYKLQLPALPSACGDLDAMQRLALGFG